MPTPQIPPSAPHPQMQRYNPLFGVLFALAGVVSLLTSQYFIGVALLCAGGAFLVYGRDPIPWTDLPRWRRLVALGLIFVGVVCAVIGTLKSFGS